MFICLGFTRGRREIQGPRQSQTSEQRANINMALIRFSQKTFLFLLASIAFSTVVQSQDHWVGTWAAAPISMRNDAAQFGASDLTYREIVHVTLGGNRIRIALSNEFGVDPLTIGAAVVALST